MEKLEVGFTARKPYDENSLSLSNSLDFEIDVSSNPQEIVRQFNKFLVLNDLDFTVVIK